MIYVLGNAWPIHQLQVPAGKNRTHAYRFKPETQRQRGVGELERWEGWNGVELGRVNVRAKCTPILVPPEALHCEAHQHHEKKVDDSWAELKALRQLRPVPPSASLACLDTNSLLR